jgi:hypothetical protein
MPLFLAVYVRISINKKAQLGERISLFSLGSYDPIFLCGIPVETFEEAEAQVRYTVKNSPSRNFVIPKVMEYRDDETFIDVCDRALEHFERKLEEMNEADTACGGNLTSGFAFYRAQ